LWDIIKKLFIFSNLFLSFIFPYLLSFKLFRNKKIKNTKNINLNKNDLNLKLGYNNKNELITISEKSLYQNILVTGAIGTGKTSSAMYPITNQLIE